MEWWKQASKKPFLATSPNGDEVPFAFPALGHRSKTIVNVDPQKIDAYWRNNSGNFVERGNPNEIKGRIDGFGDWFNGQEHYHRGKQSVNPPIAYFDKNRKWRKKYQGDPDSHMISFDDGRHRFNWFKENGWKSIPVAVERKDAEDFQKMFGTEQNVAQLG